MNRLEQGDSRAAEALFAALYSELHRLSQRELARERRSCWHSRHPMHIAVAVAGSDALTG